MQEDLNGDCVILWEIEVREDYRNKGVASLLHARLEKDMKRNGDTSIILFYNYHSTLNSFYEKLGYSIGDNLHVASKNLI